MALQLELDAPGVRSTVITTGTWPRLRLNHRHTNPAGNFEDNLLAANARHRMVVPAALEPADRPGRRSGQGRENHRRRIRDRGPGTRQAGLMTKHLGTTSCAKLMRPSAHERP